MVIKRLNKLKNDRRGFLVRTWVVAFLIFSATFALMFFAAQDLASDYGESDIIKDEYEDTYNVFDDTEDEYRGLFDSISEGGENKWGIIGTGLQAMTALVDLVKITFNSVRVVDGVTTDFVTDFGVPESIANIIFPLAAAIVMVILIFAVISAVNRGNKL